MLNDHRIFYSCLMPDAIEINDHNLFYKFCLDKTDNSKLGLDIGADTCEGLVDALLQNEWLGEICAFDVWLVRDPLYVSENVTYRKGDALKTVDTLLKEKNQKIGVLELDIRGIEPELLHENDQDLDLENPKSENILDLCLDYLEEGSIVIISEFHSHPPSFRNILHDDAIAFSKSFAKLDKRYKCICYSETKSAWIIASDEDSLYKDQLNKLIQFVHDIK
jgi:hypothetical protein